MDGFGSGHRPYGGVGERRLGIVSGRGFSVSGGGNHNMIDATRSETPNQRPSQGWPSHVASKPWAGFGDPEMKRKRRIARYKIYTVEGQIRASLKTGLRWIKNKCSQIVH